MRAITRSKLETAVTVTALTLLIWLLAEGRTVQERRTVLQVQLTAPNGQELIITPTTPLRVEMLYRCATAQQARVEELTQEPLEIDVTADPDDPQRVLVLRDRLAAHPALRDLGVEIQRLQPATIEARVERVARIERPLTVDPGELHLAASASVEPERATIRLPARLADRADAARLRVPLDAVRAQELAPGEPHTREMPIELPPDLRRPDVTVSPGSAEVTFQLLKRDEKLTLGRVPVLMLAPPTALADYRVSLAEGQRVLRDVTLRGPSDQIERIRRGDFSVWARFRLTAADLASRVGSAPLTLDLPRGVSVASPVPLPRADLAIEKRTE